VEREANMAISAVSKDFIVKHGLVVSTTATILGTENSVSTSTGALIVAGGAGIGGNLNAQNVFVPHAGVVGYLDGTGTNYVAFKSATTITNSIVWELPDSDGLSGQVLITNGSSKLSWVDAPTNPYVPFPTGDYGLGEIYPGSEGAIVDAFGVNLQATFDAMYPEGAIRLTDLGVL
jgi:hypothetical protein